MPSASFGSRPGLADSERRTDPGRHTRVLGLFERHKACPYSAPRAGTASFSLQLGMADKLNPERRSALMSRIRSKDTQPEMVVRRMLHALGYRYVLHDKRLPGKPDLVFPAKRKVVFVNGCFWHGHTCGRGFRPVENAQFWAAKVDGNKARDRRNVRAIRAQGWRVFTVWECAVHPKKIAALQRRLMAFLNSQPDRLPTAGPRQERRPTPG